MHIHIDDGSVVETKRIEVKSLEELRFPHKTSERTRPAFAQHVHPLQIDRRQPCSLRLVIPKNSFTIVKFAASCFFSLRQSDAQIAAIVAQRTRPSRGSSWSKLLSEIFRKLADCCVSGIQCDCNHGLLESWKVDDMDLESYSAKHTWESLRPQRIWKLALMRLGYRPVLFHTWEALLAWIGIRVSHCPPTLRKLTVQAVIYRLWRERNQRLHNGGPSSPQRSFKEIDRQIRNAILARKHRRNFKNMMSIWLRHE
ncbi:hypothetical protein HA466_0105300 [Hirschfeldia incana]|nr:hypothetical protein HA466_0105300 [Hirschfeldia incana]